MTRPLATLIALALLALPPRATAAQATLALRDGADRGTMRGFGRLVRNGGLHDADGACDGICTFEFEAPCLQCLLGRGCPTPGAAEAVCHGPTFGRVCAPIEGRYAVPLGGKRHAVQRKRFGRLSVVLRCSAAGCASTTTTTLPPGTPDLSGHWTLTDGAVMDDCPTQIGGTLAQNPSPHPVELAQDGETLRTCVDRYDSFNGQAVSVSSSGFTFGTGSCCEVVGGGFDYAFEEHLLAGPPNRDDTIPVTRQWNLARAGGLPGPSTCTRTLTGTMRRTVEPCQRHEDCLRADPCGRCVEGTCRPRCRPLL